MNSFINQEQIIPVLKKTLEKEFEEILKPVIEEATEKAKKEIQKKIAQVCIGLIDTQFSVERYGTDLRIIIKYDK